MSCDSCERDCPVSKSHFLDRLEEALRSIQQGFILPEVIVQHSIRQNDSRYDRMTEVYVCFNDGEFDLVDCYWKTGQGYVCGILRGAFYTWEGKGLEKDAFGSFVEWDREYFSKPANRS
jgi:hypothetical protein